MNKIKIYIVQGDPRDHGGEILLVTKDINKAKLECFSKILEWNNADNDRFIHEDAEKMTVSKFLDKYLGSMWISSPQLTTHVIEL